jgi:iron complex outermembrane receptor protein
MVRNNRKGLLVGVALCAIVSANPAYAQDAAEEDQTAEEVTDPAESGAIVVTGSRIRSVTPFNSPDPIAVLDPEVAKKEGRTDLASTLQGSSIAAGSTQVTAALSSNFVTNGGPGAQTIDLRGLGANRTLVLLNGRRAGPAGTRGGVSSFDLNVLPLSIVNDIQILKTGASSVYGSDAVAGVVNIFTKNKLDGLTLDLNASVPFDSGGENFRISGAWGKVFDRGHIMIAGDYSKTQELARGDRSYLACPAANIFDENGNSADLIDPRTGQPHCEDLRWGHVWTYIRTQDDVRFENLRLDGPGGPNTGIQTTPGAVQLMQYQYATGPGAGALGIPAFGAPTFEGDFSAPAGWFPTGYDAASMAVQNAYHPFVEQSTIIPETDLYTAYAEGAFEISSAVEVFGEFLFNRRETYQNGWRQFWNFGYTGDVYGTGGFGTLWADGFTGFNFLSPTGITDLSDSSQKVDYYRGVAGVRGEISSSGNWTYDIHGQYSRNIGRYRSQQILQDVYNTGYFQSESCVGTVTPISGRQCIDLPWADPFFLRGELTPEQAAFLTDWEEGRTLYTQKTVEAIVAGELLTLPGGPLAVAFGASVREDKINDTPGEITRAANAWGASASGITAGKSLTSEAFAEINMPLLADKPFIEELNLSAAGRITNVTATRESDGFEDEDNGNWTYKIGLNWTVTDWLRFRGSFGTSYRAPALFEQFLADETSFVPQNRIDPCVAWGANLAADAISQVRADNCAADGIPANYGGGGISATIISSGGIGLLDAETSESLVVGTILTPSLSFLPDTDISIAIDYFDIKVEGEISQLGAGTILAGCYDSIAFATEPLCDLFTRGQNATAPNQIATVRDRFINVSSQRNQGIDLSVRVGHDLGSLGTLSITADMTWQITDESRLLPASPLLNENGFVGSPKWVGDFRANWSHPSGFSLFYGMNVIGAASSRELFDRGRPDAGGCLRSFNNQGTEDPSDDLPIYGVYCPDLDVPATFYHNISVSQEIADGRFTITAGVSNLFDTRPPPVSVLNGNTIGTLGPVAAVSQYDFVGRRGFINVSTKF